MVWACLTPRGIAALEVLKDRLRLKAAEYQRILTDHLPAATEKEFPERPTPRAIGRGRDRGKKGGATEGTK